MPQQTRERRNTDKEILSQIADMKALLEAMQRTEAARVEREAHLVDTVNKDHEIINGNGKPGLKTDVQLLKEGMGRINLAFGVFTAAVIGDIVTRLLQ